MTASDVAAVTTIYGGHVETGIATWEYDAPDADTMRQRWQQGQGLGLPWLVAVSGGAVVGFAYAAPYRLRPGWAYTAEDSIYLAPAASGRGFGRHLLGTLVRACEDRGLRQLLAVIGDSANAASRGVHRACGFREVGVLAAVGWKHQRWIDSVIMQRQLGPGDDGPPSGPGIVS